MTDHPCGLAGILQGDLGAIVLGPGREIAFAEFSDIPGGMAADPDAPIDPSMQIDINCTRISMQYPSLMMWPDWSSMIHELGCRDPILAITDSTASPASRG